MKFYLCKHIYLLESIPIFNKEIAYLIHESKYNFKYTAPEVLIRFECIINKCIEMKQLNIPVDEWLQNLKILL